MGQPILEVEHLKKSYVNNVPILDDVSFSLQKGEVVVIVGPSGCGKVPSCDVSTAWKRLTPVY